jgi:hypothetical protein
VFCGLLYADCRLDGFINCHRKISVHNSLESTKHPPWLAGASLFLLWL